MENLQPLITHRFWVCFAAAVLLIPAGWWVGSSSLSKEIVKNKGDIEAAENGIPKGADHPNKDWIKGLKVVVAKRGEFHEMHAAELWQMQRSVMTWPASVAPAMATAKFFGPGNDENVRETYRTVYYIDTIERLYKIVDPIGRNGSGAWLGYDPDTRKVTNGKVLFNYDTLPKIGIEVWNQGPPEWRAMWEAQQDAWLLEALLKSIKRVNDKKRTKNINDASIREIVSLILRGGSPKTETAASSSTTDGGKGASAPDGGGGIGRSSKGGMGSTTDGAGAGAGAGAGGAGGPLQVNGDAVFGKEVPRDAPPGSESSDGGKSGEGVPMPTAGDSRYGSSREGRGQGNANLSPYVDNDPAMPFKTRGFILQVLMHRKDLPRLIQELTDAKESRFPVEILLIHEVDRDIDHTGVAVLSRAGHGAGGAGETDGGFNPMSRAAAGSAAGGAAVTDGQISRPRPSGGVLGSSPRPMGVPMSGIVKGEGDGNAGAEPGRGVSGSEPYANALHDPGLGYVVIAGLMTIYQPPKDAPQKVATEPAKSTSPAAKVDTKSPPKSKGTPAGTQSKPAAASKQADPKAAPKSKAEPGTKTGPSSKPEVKASKPAAKGTPVPSPKSTESKAGPPKAAVPIKKPPATEKSP